MRSTEVLPETPWNSAAPLQVQLDAFWNLIEDKFEEEWVMEISGTLNLKVDEKMLVRILNSNPAVAAQEFGCFEEHNPEERRWEWINLPIYLCGLYSITGVYNNRWALVDGPRSYSFDMDY